MVIKHVGPLSCAKIAAVLYAIVGFIIGGIVSLISLAGGFATAAFAGDPSRSTRLVPFLLGTLAVIAFPILYAVMGFVGALIAAWLYNIAAGVVGGVKVDLQPGD